MHLRLLLTVLILSGPLAVRAADAGLPRSTPEAQGIASADLLDFVSAADAQVDAMNSFMLVRHGHVVAEGWWTPYRADAPHILYSLTKSFTSTAVGIAVSEGKLSLDDRVVDWFPDDLPEQPSDHLQAMRVRDLLRMATGHESEPDFRNDEASWVRTFLAHHVPHRPGTHFLYNTPASHMLSVIVQKATGETAEMYLRPRLFEPLGMGEPLWLTSPQGETVGGFGLSVTTEDIAKFGQLYLQRGLWRGRALLTGEWVDLATSMQVANGSNPDSDWNQGYGFQFWRSRHDSYRGDGAFGQFAIVLPGQDAVVAITSGVKDMQQVMNLVFERLLPAMRAAPLADNPEDFGRLEVKLASLRLKTVAGQATSTHAGRASGRTYTFDDNSFGIRSIALNFEADPGELHVRTAEGRSVLPLEFRGWARGRTKFAFGLERMLGLPAPPHAMAANGAWVADDVFAVKLCLYETPFYTTLRFRFDESQMQLDVQPHVNFGPTEPVSLVGRAE